MLKMQLQPSGIYIVAWRDVHCWGWVGILWLHGSFYILQLAGIIVPYSVFGYSVLTLRRNVMLHAWDIFVRCEAHTIVVLLIKMVY